MKKTYLVILVFAIALSLAACGGENKHEEMNHNSDMHENHEHQMKSAEEANSEIIREGIIDVESLDKNGDGKIFECPMDWNVLNDDSGSCPTCGMNLKEYSLADVKANLDKYGYEYKK